MSQYYYFVASLPILALDIKPPLSLSDFLQSCEQHLSSEDYSLIRAIILNENISSESASGVFGRWVQFNHRLRNQLAVFRAKKFNKDPAKYIRGEFEEDYHLTVMISDASRSSDPLTAEKFLDRARWAFLDELATGYYFEFEAVMIYGLKLQMLERYQEIGSPKGRELSQEYKKIKIPAIQ